MPQTMPIIVMNPICGHVARLRSPNCQKITLVSSRSFEKYWRMVAAPAHRADRATPTRMMLSGVAKPMRENSRTTMLEVIAPTKAHAAITLMPTALEFPRKAGMTSKIATVAPNAAPCEMPTVEAEASGFSNTL